jgi:hypothetical protein
VAQVALVGPNISPVLGDVLAIGLNVDLVTSGVALPFGRLLRGIPIYSGITRDGACRLLFGSLLRCPNQW